jgi:hypothetical protein
VHWCAAQGRQHQQVPLLLPLVPLLLPLVLLLLLLWQKQV